MHRETRHATLIHVADKLGAHLATTTNLQQTTDIVTDSIQLPKVKL